MSKARELAELGAAYNDGALANRNLVINGGMQVWQRATSATTTVNTAYNTVDRFKFYTDSDGSFTSEQSTGHRGDTGHDTALKCVCTGTDTSLGATQAASVSTRLEAQNLQHLRYGTSNAKTLTVSFWVRSSKTGIYSFALTKNDATAYNLVSEYTINSANTWEHKTISIPALTVSSIANDNGVGLSIEFALAYGSTYRTSTLDQWMTDNDFASTNQVNWLDSTSNNWYLTGFQIEVGSEATPFEHRSFAQELRLCQRYFAKSYPYSTAIGAATGKAMVQTDFHENNQGAGYREKYDFQFPVEMRASPTITQYDSAGTSGKVNYYIGVSSTANYTVSVGNLNARCMGGYSDRSTTIGGWAFHYTANAEL